MMKINTFMSLPTKRSLFVRFEADEEEEQEVCAAFVAYIEAVKHAKAVCMANQSVCEGIISLYVKHRGGLQACRVFSIPDVKFNPSSLCEKYFIQHFRFSHAEMDRVILSLYDVGFPAVIKTKSRDKCSLYEAFCMTCFKFAWPMRLGTMTRVFGASTSRMSRIISALRSMLFKHFASQLKHPELLSLESLERFCAVVRPKSGLSICFAFIDGTVRPMCKPSVLQGSCYNGKDRTHALKYQAVTTPDGMFLQLSGPWPGSRHDQFMVKESGILEYVVDLPRRADGALFVIYGDQGYSTAPGIETPYFDDAVDAAHAAYNEAMSASRICVEWSFGGILQNWAHNAFTPQQQLLSNRKIGQVYIVAALLTNFLNCLRPNNTSQYFGLSPPVLEVYVRTMYRH
jgi:hypothetical protein